MARNAWESWGSWFSDVGTTLDQPSGSSLGRQVPSGARTVRGGAAATPGLWGHPCHHDRWEWSPSSMESITRRAPVPLIPCRASLRFSSQDQPVSLEKPVGSFLQNAIALRGAKTGPPPSRFPLTRPGFRPLSGAGSRSFYRPPLPLTRPLSRVRGEFTGECGGRLTGSRSSPVAGPARVRSGPGAGSAGTRLRLRLFAKRAAGRGPLANSPSGPGSARSRPGALPLWRHPPRWTWGMWAIHPAARSRLLRGVASRDQPQGNPPWHSGSRRWTRLRLGVGHGSLRRHTVVLISHTFWARVIALVLRDLAHFCDACARAGTAQSTNPGGVAGARPPVASAWGPSRWSSGRPSHRLGTMVPGSFTSHLSIHVNRTGGRGAEAPRAACLAFGKARLRRGTGQRGRPESSPPTIGVPSKRSDNRGARGPQIGGPRTSQSTDDCLRSNLGKRSPQRYSKCS